MPSTPFAKPLPGYTRSSSQWVQTRPARGRWSRRPSATLISSWCGSRRAIRRSRALLPSSTNRAVPSAARMEGMRRSTWSSSPTRSDMRAFTRHRPIARLMTSTRHDRRRRHRSGFSVSRTTARERRELQANVFAREFLLPRAEARRWHLTERLGAAAIADGLQLPKDLVRQQLLDALLLPDAPPSEPANGHGVRPDPSQDAAAGHRGSAFQLQAGPGTGKTRTLVKRVVSLVHEGIDPGPSSC